MNIVAFEALKGEILTDILVNGDKTEVILSCQSGRKFRMFHHQDCCEHVSLEDIDGDLHNLIGHPLLQAEESTSQENPLQEYEESFTWTFYRMATIMGSVVLRWYGSSNGYYSESVDVEQIADASKNFLDMDDMNVI